MPRWWGLPCGTGRSSGRAPRGLPDTPQRLLPELEPGPTEDGHGDGDYPVGPGEAREGRPAVCLTHRSACFPSWRPVPQRMATVMGITLWDRAKLGNGAPRSAWYTAAPASRAGARSHRGCRGGGDYPVGPGEAREGRRAVCLVHRSGCFPSWRSVPQRLAAVVEITLWDRAKLGKGAPRSAWYAAGCPRGWPRRAIKGSTKPPVPLPSAAGTGPAAPGPAPTTRPMAWSHSKWRPPPRCCRCHRG